jgi:hypothetical protein
LDVQLSGARSGAFGSVSRQRNNVGPEAQPLPRIAILVTAGVRFQLGHCGDRNGMGPALLPRTRRKYFCKPRPHVSLLVFLLVSATIDDERHFKFNWLLHYAVVGQGHQTKNTRNNNNLQIQIDSGFFAVH